MSAQVPQYLLISVAEILVSVTALAHAYEQAPLKYKGLVMALFCVCQAVGNVLLALLTLSNFASRAWQFFAMAALMLVTLALFLLFARNYRYGRESEATQLPCRTTMMRTTERL